MNLFTSSSTPNLARVRYVTGHYQQIQGLRLLPLGLWLLGMTLYEAYFKPLGFTPGAERTWQVTLLYYGGPIVVLLLYGFIGAFYQGTFGNVQPVAQQRSLAFSGVLLGVGALLLLYLSSSLELLQHAQSIGVALAIVLGLGWAADRYRKDYAVLFVIVVGVLMYGRLRSTEPSLSYTVAALLTWSSVIIFGGLFDHLLLVRTLKPVPEDNHEPAN